MVCEYSGLPATEFCPFGVPGTVTMTPALDAALSGNVNQNADGTAANQCPHNAAFFADPNANAIIAQQQLELDARHMLANYDAQMANLQAALQNAQAVLLNAQQQAAADYAASLGLAFQIEDDILDVVGDAAKLGKATGMDQNKNTFVRLHGVEACRARITEETQRAVAALAPFGQAEFLTELAQRLTSRDH